MASKADEVTSARPSSAEWVTQRERGSLLALRIMTFISLRFGRRVGRLFLYLIAAYFFTFAPTPRRHMIAYLRRVLGRRPTALERFRHVLAFATTVHDRVYLINGRFDLFDITVEGDSCIDEALQRGQGGFLMGSHLGSFEVIHCVGRQQPGLRIAMAMYEDHARKVNLALAAINPAALPQVIALGRVDTMLKIREDLERGIFVGVLGDRTLGDEPAQQVNFLGAPAQFPLGAMRAAAIMRRPVIFMIGLYCGGNRYRIVFEPLADFSQIEAGGRERAVGQAIEKYAGLLERYCRNAPYNWFNFFDFWRGGHDTPR